MYLQFFLSKRAVYLLLWSTRQGFEHAGLEFWLSSIASHAPKTPIFVIGTHCDQVILEFIRNKRKGCNIDQLKKQKERKKVERSGLADRNKKKYYCI